MSSPSPDSVLTGLLRVMAVPGIGWGVLHAAAPLAVLRGYSGNMDVLQQDPEAGITANVTRRFGVISVASALYMLAVSASDDPTMRRQGAAIGAFTVLGNAVADVEALRSPAMTNPAPKLYFPLALHLLMGGAFTYFALRK